MHDNFVDGEGKRNAYWQICTKNNEVYISWVWRESTDVASNHDICFAKSFDGGKTWANSKNETYSIPINIQTAETICLIPQNSNLINQTSLTVDYKGNPYIATYFKGKDDTCTQFYLIYFDGQKWNASRATNRIMDFELGGTGSRSIPISRPQVVCQKTKSGKSKLWIIYRDEEFNNRIVLTEGVLKNNIYKWQTFPITDFSVDRWEPSYDTELWRSKKQLHLYVQKVGQGHAETSVSMQAQMVRVLEIR